MVSNNFLLSPPIINFLITSHKIGFAEPTDGRPGKLPGRQDWHFSGSTTTFLSTLATHQLRHPCPSLRELTITCQALVKKLGQVPAEQGSLSEPTTAAYVFNGAYIPLACRLTQEVQILCSTGETHLVPQVLRAGPNIAPTSNLGEALRLLPGETVHTQANTGADVPKVTS